MGCLEVFRGLLVLFVIWGVYLRMRYCLAVVCKIIYFASLNWSILENKYRAH